VRSLTERVTDHASTEEVARSIWQLTEDALELLRSRSTAAVHRQKRPDYLWLDELTGTQSNMVIAIRQLCEASPEGVTLKKLAETIGVTPAAASAMVDVLVKKKLFRRTKSKSDRRTILIRLTPRTSELFDVSDSSLIESFIGLEHSLGFETLHDWQRILMTVTAALRQVVGETTEAEASPSETTASGDDQVV